MNDKTNALLIDKFIENFLLAVDFQEPVNVSADTKLIELPEWDSLAALGVIVMFDVEYGKSISAEHLKQSKTVGDLYQILG